MPRGEQGQQLRMVNYIKKTPLPTAHVGLAGTDSRFERKKQVVLGLSQDQDQEPSLKLSTRPMA